MDGVVCDMVGQIAKLLKLDRDKIYRDWPRGAYTVAGGIGVDDKLLWAEIAKAGPEFWETIEEYPWTRELYSLCTSLCPCVRFLTAPTSDGSCPHGKMTWMQKFSGNKHFRHFIVTTFKQDCAKWNRILIDDKDQNYDEFTAEGGRVILFPQPWNKNHAHSADPMAYVRQELARQVRQIEEAIHE